MMTNMEVGKVDPLLELPEVCMRAGKSAKKKVGRDFIKHSSESATASYILYVQQPYYITLSGD